MDDVDVKICDFFGNSCFNSFLDNGLAKECKEKCDGSCNEIKYTKKIYWPGVPPPCGAHFF